MEPQIWFFRGLNIHDRLPSEVVEAIKNQGRIERWGHQAEIFHESAGGRVYIVLKGGVYVHDGTSAERVRLKQGDLFGALVPDDVVPDGVDPAFRRKLQAFDDTLLVSLDRTQFESMTGAHLTSVEARLGRLGNRRDYQVPVSPLLYSAPADRFAKLFLHLAEDQGQIEGKAATIDFPFHPEKIAPLIGVDSTYSKQLAEQFLRRGLIENSPKFITIPDMDALRQLLRIG